MYKHKETKNTYCKRWRKENSERYKAYYRAITQKRQHEISQLKLAAGCADCGYNDNPVALDFDHVRGEKFRDVSRLLTYSWKRILQEVAKCDVVCANCHRIRTKQRPLSSHKRSRHDRVKHEQQILRTSNIIPIELSWTVTTPAEGT